MLQHFEQLSSVFAQAVSVWSTEYGVRAIIGEVIRSVHFSFTDAFKLQFYLRSAIETLILFPSGKLVRSQVKSLPEKVLVSKLLPLFCQNSVAWYQN